MELPRKRRFAFGFRGSSFSVGDCFKCFTDQIVSLADRKDGSALPTKKGPVRVKNGLKVDEK
jgi:hypothetical protein